ncbi:hypothetical protein [Bradyrhizobium sp. F1.13.3]|uniref:hypothetical protein n=1 Tax=Bradyrhizobium sp. F1.13.3 TaxID=3156351 RepID=UPI00339488E3
MEGFYVAYLTGRAGSSLLLFAIRGSDLIGVDAGGLKYDGKVSKTTEGWKCTVVYTIPAGSPELITGADAPSTDQRIPLEFSLPPDFSNGQIIGIATPLGPVNAKFQKLREW